MSDKETLLHYALENGIIDMSSIEQQYNMAKRGEYLQRQKIWQGKNGRWYTYLPGDDGKRRQVSKKNKSDLEDYIVDFWKDREINPTVKGIFDEWLERKIKYGDICGATVDRYKDDYKNYFQTFGKRKIKSVTEMDIEDFLRSTVAEAKLTRKSYSNVRTLMYGIFRLARKKKLIDYNIKTVIEDIDFSRKSFRTVPRENDSQIFLESEEAKVIGYLTNHIDCMNLALLLMFKTGLRIGEIVALEVSDIYDGKVHVCKTETRVSNHFEIKDHPKTDAGFRSVIVKKDYFWILKRIENLPRSGSYLFELKGKRVTAQRLRRRLYSVCDKVGIDRKSPHKVRKTYGTKLIDSGITQAIAIEQMGHTDISCLQKHYYFNRYAEDYKQKEIDQIQTI